MSYVYEYNVKNMKEFFGIVEGKRGELYRIRKINLFVMKKSLLKYMK